MLLAACVLFIIVLIIEDILPLGIVETEETMLLDNMLSMLPSVGVLMLMLVVETTLPAASVAATVTAPASVGAIVVEPASAAAASTVVGSAVVVPQSMVTPYIEHAELPHAQAASNVVSEFVASTVS